MNVNEKLSKVTFKRHNVELLTSTVCQAVKTATPYVPPAVSPSVPDSPLFLPWHSVTTAISRSSTNENTTSNANVAFKCNNTLFIIIIIHVCCSLQLIGHGFSASPSIRIPISISFTQFFFDFNNVWVLKNNSSLKLSTFISTINPLRFKLFFFNHILVFQFIHLI